MKTFIQSLLAFAAFASASAAEVNLYTDREEAFLRAVISAYEAQSGDTVNVLSVKKGLIERVRAEGASSPADAFLVVDAGRIAEFADAGMLAPAPAAPRADIPDALQDPEGRWFAVTRRARVLYAAPGASPESYQDLASPEYRGALCFRSGTHPYNNALFADLLNRIGSDAMRQWMEDVKENLARTPRGKDRSQIDAVANGQCKVGVANSYYYHNMIRNAEPERAKLLRENVDIVAPSGLHINVTGMGLAKNAPNPEAAKRMMAFFTSKEAQTMFAEENFEFPARNDVEFPEELRSLQDAVRSASPRLLQAVARREEASRLVDETGFDR